MKNLSIIIPTLNEEDYISAVLEGIARQQYPDKLQIIVVDGNSDDDTILKIESYKNKIDDLEIIKSKERGVSLQRNLGASFAKYEHLLFMDADVVLPDSFLVKLRKKIPKEDVVALVVHIPPRFNLLDYLWLGALYGFIFIVQWYRPICSGSFLLTTRSVHVKVGGFNERTVMGGDVIYGFDSVKKGGHYKLFFWPYVLGYPRRLRKEGRIVLLSKWLRGYLYMIRYGPIFKESNLHEYEFANYSKEDKY